MTSSTSSKATVRVLSAVLIIAILYLILVPAHSTNNVAPPTNKQYEAPQFGIDTSLVKSTGGRITHTVTGNSEQDAGEEQSNDSIEDEDEAIGDQLAAGKVYIDEEQLTEEEKAVQEYHQQHGQNQPTRDRPKLPVKPDSKSTSASASQPTPIITEVSMSEIRHRTHLNNAANAEHLVLVVTQDQHHWGHIDGPNGAPRTFSGFLQFLNDTSGLALSSISLAILTTTEEAYTHYITTLSDWPLAKSQVLLYKPAHYVPEPEDRHDPSYQPIRRKQIAEARNMLMLRALNTESHIFFYDADVVDSSPGLAVQMLSHATASSPNVSKHPDVKREKPLPVGLITTRCQDGNNGDYDLNAWSHNASLPLTVPPRNRPDSLLHMAALVPLASSSELVPLDSVGGVVLYIKAELVRRGLNFPSYYVVGGNWGDEGGFGGYDGLETEGICWVAERLGVGCYGLGGEWFVKHSH